MKEIPHIAKIKRPYNRYKNLFNLFDDHLTLFNFFMSFSWYNNDTDSCLSEQRGLVAVKKCAQGKLWRVV